MAAKVLNTMLMIEREAVEAAPSVGSGSRAVAEGMGGADGFEGKPGPPEELGDSYMAGGLRS